LADLNDVMLALGRVQEGVDRLTADLRDEKTNAHESRATLHRRLDEQSQEISSIREDIVISAHVDAQVRGEIKKLSDLVEANHATVAPSLEEWKRMKTLGIGLAGLMAIGGMSIGAALLWMGETAANAVRQWLRIT